MGSKNLYIAGDFSCRAVGRAHGRASTAARSMSRLGRETVAGRARRRAPSTASGANKSCSSTRPARRCCSPTWSTRTKNRGGPRSSTCGAKASACAWRGGGPAAAALCRQRRRRRAGRASSRRARRRASPARRRPLTRLWRGKRSSSSSPIPSPTGAPLAPLRWPPCPAPPPRERASPRRRRSAPASGWARTARGGTAPASSLPTPPVTWPPPTRTTACLASRPCRA